jgi:serine/threonine protein kinase
MNPELLHFHSIIVACKCPEDLFGNLSPDPLQELKTLYRRFARIAHADHYLRTDEQHLAHVVFTRLNEFHQQALSKLSDGTYGTKSKPSDPSFIKSSKRTYEVKEGITKGDLSTVYRGIYESKSVIIKVSSDPSFNPLMETEATILKKLNQSVGGTTSFKYFIPTLVDSFRIQDSIVRQVNVFESVDGFRSLTDIHAIFPKGIDQRHFVWIFNRLLSTLSFVHPQKIVHGAILPDHILVHPVTHAIHLIDWCFAVPCDSLLRVIPVLYGNWYPQEVLNKDRVGPFTDLYMAAKCMFYILGEHIHPKFKRLLNSCMIKHPMRRQSDAWELYEEFQTLSKEVFGSRKYIQLVLD